MMTAQYEWKILEWDEKLQTNKTTYGLLERVKHIYFSPQYEPVLKQKQINRVQTYFTAEWNSYNKSWQICSRLICINFLN